MQRVVFISLFAIFSAASLSANTAEDQIKTHLHSYIDALRVAFKTTAPEGQPIYEGNMSIKGEAESLAEACRAELPQAIVQLKATADAWWDYKNQRAGKRKDLDAIHKKMSELSDECTGSIEDSMRNIYERLINLSRNMEY